MAREQGSRHFKCRFFSSNALDFEDLICIARKERTNPFPGDGYCESGGTVDCHSVLGLKLDPVDNDLL
jgi:hypothetical protein